MRALCWVGIVGTMFALACGGSPTPANETTTPDKPARAAPLVRFQNLGTGERVAFARIRMGPAETRTVAASPCQELIIFVEKGAVRPDDGDGAWLRHGEAMRFYEDAELWSAGDGETLLFAVAVVSRESSATDPIWTETPQDDCEAPTNNTARSNAKNAGPFVHAGGRLRVMIYLDCNGEKDDCTSFNTLDADPNLGVPEHVHSKSSEILWIQDGSGVMRLGDDTVRIQPGTFVYVPPNTVHGYRPDGNRPLFAYQVYTPAGPEERFRTK